VRTLKDEIETEGSELVSRALGNDTTTLGAASSRVELNGLINPSGLELDTLRCSKGWS
jgi:hypothetical protein